MRRNVIWLVIGIIVFSLGAYQFYRYEESSVEVSAVITDIDSKELEDGYRHVYYGEYTVAGEKYEGVKLNSRYTDSMMPDSFVGDTVKIVVSGSSPGKKMSEGGLFGVVGLILTVYNGIVLYRARKTYKNSAAAANGAGGKEDFD